MAWWPPEPLDSFHHFRNNLDSNLNCLLGEIVLKVRWLWARSIPRSQVPVLPPALPPLCFPSLFQSAPRALLFDAEVLVLATRPDRFGETRSLDLFRISRFCSIQVRFTRDQGVHFLEEAARKRE